MRSALTFVSLLNFADWIIAAFISGAAAKIEGRVPEVVDGEVTYRLTGKRTPLAVGLAIFFGAFAILRLLEFVNGITYREEIRQVLSQIPSGFRTGSSLMASGKTLSLLFCWFAITLERRERQGIISGNIIRNFLVRWFDKLR